MASPEEEVRWDTWNLVVRHRMRATRPLSLRFARAARSVCAFRPSPRTFAR